MNVKALWNAVQLLLFLGGGLSLSVATTTAAATEDDGKASSTNNEQQEVQDLVDFFMERDVTGNEYPLNEVAEAARLRKSVQPEADDDVIQAAAKVSSNGFNIALGFTGKITNAQKQGFLNAKKRWQEIITKDAASTICVKKGFKLCGYKFTKATCIDDIFIGVAVKPMDGVGKMWVVCISYFLLFFSYH